MNYRGIIGVAAVTATVVFSSCSHRVVTDNTTGADRADTSRSEMMAHTRPMPLDSAAFNEALANTAAKGAPRTLILSKLKTLYSANDHRTMWLYDRGAGPLYAAAKLMLLQSWVHGLDPALYDLDAIDQQLTQLYSQPLDTVTLVKLDTRISALFLTFTTHLTEGRVTQVSNGKSVWKRASMPYAQHDAQLLAEVSTSDQLTALVARIQPQGDQYARLQHALVVYRDLVKHDSGMGISLPTALRPGERSAAVPALRTRVMLLTGDLPATTPIVDSLVYDEALVRRVQTFQERHGLAADGIIGGRTLKFINLPMAERAAMIALNMDRLRWTPVFKGERYLVVNIPDYMLRVYEHDTVSFAMRVVVGSASTPTPVFNDQLNHIVFSPTWTVPVSIIRNEIIPNLRKDSLYYVDKNFVIYRDGVQLDPAMENWKDSAINPYKFRVVQNPGPDNSLGFVKFMMPNNMNIYLHDTPSRRLFKREFRALSHGCVRVSEPAKLAEYLLRDQPGWNTERIALAMTGTTPATILLKKKVPVYLTYQTAWVDDKGNVQFREDIYGHDKVQGKQLMPLNTRTPSSEVSVAGM